MRGVRGQAIAFICSPAGVVQEVLLDELGVTPRLPSSRLFASLFEPEYAEVVKNFLLRVVDSNSLSEEEFQVLLPTGPTPLYCSAHASARGIIVLGGTKPLTRAAAIRRLRALLRRSRGRVADSAAGQAERLARAAHDLRNPIAGILAASQYLLDDPPAPRSEEHVMLLESIQASSRFLLQLVDDVLGVSTLDAGGAHPRREATDIQALLRQNLAINQFLAVRKGIRLRVTTDENPPAVTVNAARVSEVIDNLVGNAIKFSPDGGTIAIHLGRRDGMASLTVRDEGSGIPASEIQTVFEPFRKGSGQRNLSAWGTGLGLAIVKRIVESSGGKVEIESEVGRGSTFTVLLPIAGPETAPRRRSARQGFSI